MEDSIFTKIIKGEIPSHKIYEDDKTLAFLDIHPVQPGMTLVVPKTPAETFMDLQGEDYTAFWQAVQKVARMLKKSYPDKKRIGIQVEGLDVAYLHAKLIPINTGQEFRTEPDFNKEPDHDELTRVAEQIRNNL